jgi:predicted DNA repair protein MutK
MDDVGLALVRRKSTAARRIGRNMVLAMPVVMTVLSYVGTVAMLWVGGHIVLNGIHELGWDPLYDFVHHLEHNAADWAPVASGFVGWAVNTFFSAILGFIVGSVVVGIVHVVKQLTGKHETHTDQGA